MCEQWAVVVRCEHMAELPLVELGPLLGCRLFCCWAVRPAQNKLNLNERASYEIYIESLTTIALMARVRGWEGSTSRSSSSSSTLLSFLASAKPDSRRFIALLVARSIYLHCRKKGEKPLRAIGLVGRGYKSEIEVGNEFAYFIRGQSVYFQRENRGKGVELTM